MDRLLCDAPGGRGAWNRDGVIVFSGGRTSRSLQRVPAVGGVPTPVTQAGGPVNGRAPVFLPDGRRFLYVVGGAAEGNTGVHVASLDSQPGQRVLADNSSVAWFQPSPGSDAAWLQHPDGTTVPRQDAPAPW